MDIFSKKETKEIIRNTELLDENKKLREKVLIHETTINKLQNEIVSKNTKIKSLIENIDDIDGKDVKYNKLHNDIEKYISELLSIGYDMVKIKDYDSSVTVKLRNILNENK
jgi:hypothetical protein